MSFDQDPQEQANISGADLASMINEIKELQESNAIKGDTISQLNARLLVMHESIIIHKQRLAAFERADAVGKLIQQRDDLLAALKMIEHATAPTHDDGAYHENAYSLAVAAIAKAEASHG